MHVGRAGSPGASLHAVLWRWASVSQPAFSMPHPESRRLEFQAPAPCLSQGEQMTLAWASRIP